MQLRAAAFNQARSLHKPNLILEITIAHERKRCANCKLKIKLAIDENSTA